MSEKRDLEYYLANPHEMPGNLEEIEKLVEGEGSEESGSLEQAVNDASAGEQATEPKAAEKVVEQQAEPAAKEAEAQPVLKSRDGKHEIPYTVLQTEREQRKAAEQKLAEMQQQLAAMQSQATGTAPAQAEAAQHQTETLSDDEISKISEDFPAMGKLLTAMKSQMEALGQQLQDVRAQEDVRRQSEARSASTTVQEAIDHNPALSLWQREHPEVFQAAVQFDNQIKSDPRNQGLTLDQRFEKVVKAVTAVYEDAPLPAALQQTAPAAPKVDPQQVAAAAQKAIEQAQGKPAIRSLSDIPGGTAPAVDEMQAMGLMSAADLGNKLMSMKPEEVMALLARAA